MIIKEKIREFIYNKNKNLKIDDNDNIFQQKILDSLAFVELVVFIENNFGFQFEDEELIIENFKSINTIINVVEKKVRQ